MFKLKLVTFLIGLGIICGVNSSYAQETFVGVKGGISIPQLSGGGDNELSKDYKSRTSLNVGMFLELGITKRFSFQSELDLLQKKVND